MNVIRGLLTRSRIAQRLLGPGHVDARTMRE
jgi:hypothetical protein